MVKELGADYSKDYVKIKTLKDKAEAQAYFTTEEGAAQTVAEGENM